MTSQEFDEYWQRSQAVDQKSYVACDTSGAIMGVFNIHEIVRGAFQSAFIRFYGTKDHTGKGYMSQALTLVRKMLFEGLALHRIEANIQPENSRSIQFVKRNGFRYEGFSPRYLKINNEHLNGLHLAKCYRDLRCILKNLRPNRCQWHGLKMCLKPNDQDSQIGQMSKA